jgi:CxxC-x17-CxxC domain-containing protein
MEFQDKVLTCADCGTDFLFTAGEQAFFQEKNFRSPPKRCKSCKSKHVATLGSPHHVRTQTHNRSTYKVETLTTCSQCGKQTTVPFKPTQGRPVLCRDCYETTKRSASA